MNCKLCQQEIIAYLEGKLPEDTRAQIEMHLLECNHCSNEVELIQVANKTMDIEKATISNPFLSTRVMAALEGIEQIQTEKTGIPAYQKVLKPIFISFSIALAIFIGVVAGNVYQSSISIASNEMPIELGYMDDASLESVNTFINE